MNDDSRNHIEHADIQGAIDAERSLLDPAVRRDPDAVGALLSQRFTEIGRSGKLWTREAIIEALQDEVPAGETTASDFTARWLADDLALLIFSTDRANAVTLRSSLWRHLPDGTWQIEFHQGTPAAQEP